MHIILMSNFDYSDNNLYNVHLVSFSTENKPTTLKLGKFYCS